MNARPPKAKTLDKQARGLSKSDSRFRGNDEQKQLRRLLRITAIIAVVSILLVAALAWLAQAPRAVGFLLDRVGASLGLEIAASGVAEYRLRGTPQVVVRDLVAREPGANTPILRAKRALLSLTTGGPADAYLENGFNGDLNAILRPIQRGILNFTGFSVLQPQLVYGPVRVDDAQRQAWLAQWAQRLREIESEMAIVVGRY